MTDEMREMIRRAEDKNLIKEAIREAAKEWLSEQFAAFGKWTGVGIASGAFYIVVKTLIINGYWPK